MSDRDEQARRWNETLATGDTRAIDKLRDILLDDIHTRIMTEDPNYQKAGWTP